MKTFLQMQQIELMELAMYAIASLTRNLTSKFYTKGILETADRFLGDGLDAYKRP